MGGGIVIIGSGLGGFGVAREIRKRDAKVEITIVTGDDGASYSKPMLSNALAQGKDAASLVQRPAERMAADLNAVILTYHRVTAIERGSKTLAVTTPRDDAIALPYDRLVLAIGADPRQFPRIGMDQPAVHSVNDLADYRRWRDELQPRDRVLLIGAGLIGCEFANDLIAAGHPVSLVDPAPWPLARLLPQEMGDLLAGALQEAGVSLHLGRQVTSLRSNAAILDNGRKVEFDRVLSAIGLMPRIALAASAGLEVDKGIKVDRYLASSDRDIFAIGDCAETEVGLLPFVLPLMAQLRALAATLTGEPTPATLPALPVAVKTPCLPIVVCSPPVGRAGEWRIEGAGRDRKALFVSPDGLPLGYVLAGGATKESQSLVKTMPALL